MKKIILIVFLILLSGCINQEDKNVIKNICNAENVKSVYDCVDFVEIVNVDGSSRYYTEDGSFKCSLESPSSLDLNCQNMFNIKKNPKVICRDLC